MKYLKYSAHVVLSLIAVGGIVYPLQLGNPDAIKSSVEQETIKGYNSVPVYENGGYVGSPSEVSLSEVNREIEISPEDVKENDTDNLIGTNEPFNIRFITEEDVIDSIKSILSNNDFREDLFEGEHLPYVITLRHTEMTDMVPERDSEIIEVAKEFEEKILGGSNNEKESADSIFGE